ncbi:MAG: undecaprenyl-diphosphate phosphatase [Sphaerochaeta sp.]|jgi:undecaprenyl-diphosphatase|uniref:undecaprenyl-diphosphate phosphatase n=1 Tax=Sphaerochaeta sp. TaxID=1972642 RepID=UPI002FC82C1A
MAWELVKSLVLGVVQGITEWLPISSTGHLLLLDEFLHLGLGAQAKELFMVIIQLASILAVIILYFSTLNPFSPKKGVQERTQTYVLWLKVLIATIPAGVIGILFDSFVEEKLHRWQVIAASLFVYGVLYIILEKGSWAKRQKRVKTLESVTYTDAMLLGCFQMLALVPGTSRSGSTILGGILIGMERQVAAQFSFFMAIPVMAGASLLKLLKLGFSYSAEEYAILFVGFVSSFLVSLVCIKALVAYVRKHDFSVFGIYRVLLALLVTFYFLGAGV